MSMSNSNRSSRGGKEYKNFRQTTRDRFLYEMIESTKRADSISNWKVLILDEVTYDIISHSCKLTDIRDEGVSCVEDINKTRQPMPTMGAVYYIQPTKENVGLLVSDMARRKPHYREAYVYFSSSVPSELVEYIKQSLNSRLRAMKEMNLEYFAVDSQGFITDNTNNEMALEELYGNEEMSRKGAECLNLMANRIATVFASLSEFPFVRYRAAKSLDPTAVTPVGDLIPMKLAAAVWNCLMNYRALENFNFPPTETCELLILDRSVDQIAPIIHEWTYDAMCHDLVSTDWKNHVHEVASKTDDPPENVEALLEDYDPVWVELRHAHIEDASNRLHDIFVSKKIAEPMQFLHADIVTKIEQIIWESGLKEVGQLEQDLVFGDAGTEEVINFLTTKPDAPRENKLRLLMIYAATHPEKFESDVLTKLMELAGLPSDDRNAVYNMRFLGGSSDSKKKKHGLRKDCVGEESTWQLSRFYPMIEELVERLIENELPKNDYPCMNPANMVERPPAHSVRTRPSSSHFKKMGPRVFVFIVGGATRSELRVCHALTAKLKREVVLGSSSIDDPTHFIRKLKLLTANELSLDGLEI